MSKRLSSAVKKSTSIRRRPLPTSIRKRPVTRSGR